LNQIGTDISSTTLLILNVCVKKSINRLKDRLYHVADGE